LEQLASDKTSDGHTGLFPLVQPNANFASNVSVHSWANLGASLAALAVFTPWLPDLTRSIASAEHAIPMRPLGKTGILVTILGLGGEGVLRTWNRQEEAVAVIRGALEHGITYCDTAPAYRAEVKTTTGRHWGTFGTASSSPQKPTIEPVRGAFGCSSRASSASAQTILICGSSTTFGRWMN